MKGSIFRIFIGCWLTLFHGPPFTLSIKSVKVAVKDCPLTKQNSHNSTPFSQICCIVPFLTTKPWCNFLSLNFIFAWFELECLKTCSCILLFFLHAYDRLLKPCNVKFLKSCMLMFVCITLLCHNYTL